LLPRLARVHGLGSEQPPVEVVMLVGNTIKTTMQGHGKWGRSPQGTNPYRRRSSLGERVDRRRQQTGETEVWPKRLRRANYYHLRICWERTRVCGSDSPAASRGLALERRRSGSDNGGREWE